MNLDFTDDQRMLKDSVDRFVAQRYSLEQRRDYAAEPDGWSRGIWRELSEMGLLMLPFDAEDGGLGMGAVETMIVGNAVGRGLIIEPYLACVVLAGTAIARCGSADQRADLLPGLMDGSRMFAYADLAVVEAGRGDAGWTLCGTAQVVLAGDSANHLIIPTSEGLFVIPAATAGISRRSYRLHGGGSGASIILDNVMIGEGARLNGAGDPALVREAGIAFLAAEAAGAMQAALDLTVDYVKTREQFGKPIGANQSLQHRAAEMLVEVEQAQSAAIFAALLTSERDTVERAKGFAAVKAVIGKSARFVAQQTVQLHGGIGVSEEHVASHYFRRLTAIGMILGDTGMHLDNLATLGGFTPADRSAG